MNKGADASAGAYDAAAAPTAMDSGSQKELDGNRPRADGGAPVIGEDAGKVVTDAD